MGSDQVIYFRADGNSEIATGHLVRCLSIARALRYELAKPAGPCRDICFLVSDGESKELLNGFFDFPEEFAIRILETGSYDAPMTELPQLLSLGAHTRSQKPLLFVDSYFVTKAYFEQAGRSFRIAYIDDVRAQDFPLDYVINYDVLSKDTLAEYTRFYSSANTRLLGSSYAPLRPQFWHPPGFLLPRDPSFHILVASGGSDPYHTTRDLVSSLLHRLPENCIIHALIGRLNPDCEELKQLSLTAKGPGLILHENVLDMASLMASCQLAISAAGTTLYELCAMGIPTVSFAIADNQLPSACAFDHAGAIPFLGDVRSSGEEVIKKAASWAASKICQTEYSSLLSQSRLMQSLVDGQGALRIAKALLSPSHPNT